MSTPRRWSRADRKNLPRLGTGGHVAVPASAHSSDYLLRRAQGYFTRKVAVAENNKKRAVTPLNLLNNTCQGAGPATCLRACIRSLRGFLSSAKPLWGIPLSRPSRPTKHSPEAVRSAPPAALWHISTRGVFLETIAATIAAVMVIFHSRLHQQDRLLQWPCSNYKESRCAAAARRRRRRRRGRAGQQSEMLHPRVTSALPQSGHKTPKG